MLRHFQLKLIMCFIRVGYYFVQSRNLSTYILSISVWTQKLEAFLPPFSPPQRQIESSLGLSARRHVMFHYLGEQNPCLCYLPKDTETLHQAGNKTPTPNPRHCVPVSAETGSLLLVSKQKSCPPRINALPSSKRTVRSSGSITAALAASEGPSSSSSPSPAAEQSSFQPGRDRSAAAEERESEPEPSWPSGNSPQACSE